MTIADLRQKITVNKEEAYALTGIPVRTLEDMMKVGKGPLRVTDNPVRFRVSELERWAKSLEH